MIKRLAKQILLLTVGLLLAFGCAVLNLNFQHCGLGWSVNPGLFLFFVILIAGVLFYFEAGNMSAWPALQVIALFEAAILLEFIQMPAMTLGFMQIASIVTGESIFFRSSTIGFSYILLLIIGAYIELVFIYNMHMPYQMMYFFKSGWAA